MFECVLLWYIFIVLFIFTVLSFSGNIFKLTRGVKLLNHVIKTMQASAPTDCLAICMYKMDCLSLNAWSVEADRIEWKFNNITITFSTQADVTEGNFYYEAHIDGCLDG